MLDYGENVPCGGSAVLQIVLFEPEIPANTGNIARTCAVTGCGLHLVRPLGFRVDDKQLKRAGLDYWHLLNVCYHDSLEDFFSYAAGGRFHFVETKGRHDYTEVEYQESDYLVFGKETTGLPPELLEQREDEVIRIPMRNEARSLNLSNSVAIVTYEALRQQGFPGLR